MPIKSILTGRVLMALVMFLIFVTMVAIALDYPSQARFMPLVVGLPGIAMTLYELIREVRHALANGSTEETGAGTFMGMPDDIAKRIAAEGGPDPEEHKLTPAQQQRREWVLLGYFTGLIGGILLFGFWITVPTFIVVFLREREKAGWALTLGLTAAAFAILYFVFYRTLGIDFHNGFITDAVRDAFFPVD